jgi:hypothetical protein
MAKAGYDPSLAAAVWERFEAFEEACCAGKEGEGKVRFLLFTITI